MGFLEDLNRAYGSFDSSIGGVLPGGAERTPFAKKLMAAPEAVMITAKEAAPAITGGLFGMDRTDTQVNPKMRDALKSTAERLKREGKSVIDYSDWDSTTPGGLAARLTMGKVGIGEFTFDENGNATGMTQRFDTDKKPEDAMSEFNPKNIKTYYKPMEALLAQSQKGGVTDHDLTFGTPKPAAPSTRKAGEADISVEATAPADPQMSYAVRAGDTLSAIARSKGTTVDALAKLNNISNVNQIGIGQQLRY